MIQMFDQFVEVEHTQASLPSFRNAVTAIIPCARAKPYLSRKPLRRTTRNRLLGNAPIFTYNQLSKWAKGHNPPQAWFDE
jgi:hypothetical protein